MFPDEIWLVFLKNALKIWLPWCCSADKILHWLPLSSNNGLLFILGFRLPHLNVLWNEGRYEPGGTRGVLPSLSLMGMGRGEGLPVLGWGPGPWWGGTSQPTWSQGAAGSRGKSHGTSATHRLGGSFRMWILILSYFGLISVWQRKLSLF